MTSALGAIIRDVFDPKAKRLATTWTQDIAQAISTATNLDDYDFEALNISLEEWESTYKPALLWRFYKHLGSQINQIAEGHATVLYNTLQEGDENAEDR